MGIMPGQAVGRAASPASPEKATTHLIWKGEWELVSETVKGRALWVEGAVRSGEWKQVTVGYTIEKG